MNAAVGRGWAIKPPISSHTPDPSRSFYFWVSSERLGRPVYFGTEIPNEASELRENVANARKRLDSIQASTHTARTAQRLGLTVLDEADWSITENDLETAQRLLSVGIALIDIAIGLSPIGLGKDAYEACTGKHLLTGAPLSDSDRWLALAGIVTAGFAGALTMGIRGINRVVEAGGAAKKFSATTTRYIEHLSGAAAVVTKRSGGDANAEFIAKFLAEHPKEVAQPPWDETKAVFDFVASRDFTVWRVHRDAIDAVNPAVSDWVMRVMPKGLSPAEIKEMYALPSEVSNLKKLSTLKVPNGTRVRVGFSGKNKFGKGGAVQWQILDQPKSSWVIETVPYPNDANP